MTTIDEFKNALEAIGYKIKRRSDVLGIPWDYIYNVKGGRTGFILSGDKIELKHTKVAFGHRRLGSIWFDLEHCALHVDEFKRYVGLCPEDNTGLGIQFNIEANEWHAADGVADKKKKEVFGEKARKIINEMLDKPDKDGIYPTTECFELLDNLYDETMDYDVIEGGPPGWVSPPKLLQQKKGNET